MLGAGVEEPVAEGAPEEEGVDAGGLDDGDIQVCVCVWRVCVCMVCVCVCVRV